MKIWIDGYEANAQQRVGSGQVAFELIKAFEKLDHQNNYTICLPGSPLDDLPKAREGWQYKILKPKRFWTRIALPIALYFSKEKPDLIFSPTHYIPNPTSVKRIVTIFDLSFLKFPETFLRSDLWQLTKGTKFSARFADHIITISNSTKKDIISQYKINKEKITVAYPGFNNDIFHKSSNKSENYIIYIGTIQPRKNLIRLMEAVSKIENLRLVVVGKTEGEGKKGWKYEEILETPKRLGIEDRVEFRGFVPLKELSGLLAGAQAFVLPSLYEGFGIPVLEAMASGTPVIVSNVSSLPEVVGKAGLLVNPNSVDQIEQAIRTIVSDKEIREKYSRLGIEQAKKFSWDKMAKIILKVFASI